MSSQLQSRRGTTSQHATFTGAIGEVTVDTDKHTVVVHDGSTAGGFPLSVDTLIRSDLAAPGGALLVRYANIDTPMTSEQALDILYYGITNITNPRFAGGAVGDDATDNISAITAACAHAQANRSIIYTPSGIFRTSGAHTLTTASTGAASVLGNGPTVSIWKSTGDQDILTITGASEIAVRGIGFDKVTRNQLGKGLSIINTAYALIEHVTAYGFYNGFYTESVLTSLFTKPLARFCEIGCYLNTGASSRPNAITILNPSFSLNTRWGLRATEPASLNVCGGSIEGNGWGVASFHGGIYISNAGTEGGVGVTIDGVQMEQNHGEADIHIASTLNAGTVYNVLNCSIFPIDNTHFTDNRIYFENGVQQILNLKGNNFKHYGTYTPNASRRYIAAIDTTLLTVNTGGDSSQFFSTTETPMLATWGPNAVRDAMLIARASVSINGTPAAVFSGATYNLAAAARVMAGEVYCTFVRPFPSTEYQVIATPKSIASPTSCVFKSVNGFTIVTTDLTGTKVDCDFDVMVA